MPKPFSIALPGEEFKNQFTFNAESGKINKLVYIKFNPTQLGDVNDSLVITSLDLDTEIVPLFGTTFDPFKGLNTIYSQNFTGATNNQPPAGWLISDTLLWSIVSSNPSANYAYASGTNCLRFDNEASELPKTATATVSGKINAQFYKDIKVIWGARRTNNFFNGIIKGKAFLFCSINGTNWDTVYYTPEPNNSDLWSYVNGGNLIALPSSCNHISDVQLRWQFTGEGLGSSGTYRMDDIRVFGTLDTLTGFVETTANISSLSCYPVPANGNQITFNANEPLASIVLLDMLGKQVAFEINHNSQNIILPIQKINQGVYLASVTSVKGVTQIKRIIITR